jgi:DNA-binding response OmpR family regulator
MAPLIILVNDDRQALGLLSTALSDRGYSVAAVRTFVDAKALLDSSTPDLLIADVRLGEYNGLQLAIFGREDHPDLPVIVTNATEDKIVEADATRYGATFIADPQHNPAFMVTVQGLVAARHATQRQSRHWNRRVVSGVVEVNAANARAQILDVSYGGMRLAFTGAQEIPQTFDITLPSADVTVKVNRVWTDGPATEGQWLCGAELVKPTERRWWRFVDTLR